MSDESLLPEQIINATADVVPNVQEIPDEVLVGELLERFKDNPNLTKIVKKTQIQRRTEHFSGPIPHPDILAKYNSIEENLANRIVTMAEKQQSHRHKLEEKMLDSVHDVEKRGQNYALVISLVIIFGSMLLIARGHEWAGTSLAGATLCGLAYIFITGRKKENQKDTPQKDDANE